MIILHSMPELSLALYVPNIEHLIALFPSEMALEAPSGTSSISPSAERVLNISIHVGSTATILSILYTAVFKLQQVRLLHLSSNVCLLQAV